MSPTTGYKKYAQYQNQNIKLRIAGFSFKAKKNQSAFGGPPKRHATANILAALKFYSI